MSAPYESKITPVILNYRDLDGTDASSAVRDILTDLMHFCQDNKINFNDTVESAEEVFIEEGGKGR